MVESKAGNNNAIITRVLKKERKKGEKTTPITYL